jgi:hypothetical protein
MATVFSGTPTISLFESTRDDNDLFDFHSNNNVNRNKKPTNATNQNSEVLVKRKKKGSKFQTVADNRDSLPFVVHLTTPDPYTRPEVIKAKAKEATREDRKQKGAAKIAASIFSKDTNGDLHQILGEFQLDKQTTNGDILQVGDKQFQVQKARCQYKYIGGQQFAMVRKILEVKELTRVKLEEDIAMLFRASSDNVDDDLILE